MRGPPDVGQTALELWAGVECTINRVGDTWYDQLDRDRHRDRVEDLDLFASLGIRRLRHAVLWERHPDEKADWRAADRALERLRSLEVSPIVGLLHHGSGPAATSLTDEGFAAGLAAHAARVAARYPWVESYTPVNEPLTTARFSGLYGLWYPHARDDSVFARAVINQCRATVLAMRAIRAVNPAAQLVQTEDLGRTSSTRKLSYQADLENERRWLTWDLLCGRTEPGAPMIEFLHRAGISREELGWFAENPCVPDVIGINHYVTSDRHLDHRLQRYPNVIAGGNGHDVYVDLEAVRVLDEPQDGWLRCLTEAWARYGLPLAITEAHLACTRDEQLRWFRAAWDAAGAARDAGVDVRAVTAWSLLGSHDWNSLLTRNDGHYESGVFDMRSGQPRPTALARTLSELARGGEAAHHPAGEGLGWWHRPDRLLHAQPRPATLRIPRVSSGRQPLLIAGARGNLGKALAQVCAQRGLAYHLCNRGELDICSPTSVRAAIASVRPWAVINAAGYVRVDEAEREQEKCCRENRDGPALLAAVCSEHSVRFATFSSDLVFDGESRVPYVESSVTAPLNVYGMSKAQCEQAVLETNPAALVIRTSSFFGPWHSHDFLTTALRALSRREPFAAMDDVTVSHTYVPDLSNACIDLLIDAEEGLWHLANPGALTWLRFAELGAACAGIDARRLIARSCESFGLAARRPAYSALATERGFALPPLEDALARYVRDATALWNVAA